MNHLWGAPDRMIHKTERECTRGCRIVMVSLHPFGRDGRVHETEFWRDGELISKGSKRPKCEPVEVTT